MSLRCSMYTGLPSWNSAIEGEDGGVVRQDVPQMSDRGFVAAGENGGGLGRASGVIQGRADRWPSPSRQDLIY